MSSSLCFGIPFRPAQHPTTLALVLVVLGLSAFAALGFGHSLCLIWNHTFMTQFYFWNVLTGNFLESSLIKLAVSLVGIIGMGPVVEASLGHIGLAVYLLLVGLASGLVTSTGIFFAYIVTRQEYLLDLELHGTFGLIAALAVAGAQQDPGGSFLPDGRAAWFPKRCFPLLLVTVSAVGRAMAVPVVSRDFPFVVVGAYVAWAYLRFFGHIILGGPCGDVNPEFQLMMFFPQICRRFVKPCCDFTYGVFLLLGFFKGRAAQTPLPAVDGQGGVDTSVVTLLPTPERKDPIAERRRARAMKLLDEKFAKLNAKPTNGWDDDEGWDGGEGAGSTRPAAAIGLAATRLSTSPVSQAENGTAAGHGDDDDWGMAAGDDNEGGHEGGAR